MQCTCAYGVHIPPAWPETCPGVNCQSHRVSGIGKSTFPRHTGSAVFLVLFHVSFFGRDCEQQSRRGRKRDISRSILSTTAGNETCLFRIQKCNRLSGLISSGRPGIRPTRDACVAFFQNQSPLCSKARSPPVQPAILTYSWANPFTVDSLICHTLARASTTGCE